MGGELGNESINNVYRYVLLLIGSSATPAPIFGSVGNDDFVAKFVLKNRRFGVSADESMNRRDRVGI